MDRLLITGGSGFVGQNLREFFAPRGPVIATYLTHPIEVGGFESARLDVRDAVAVLSVFERAAPDVVIHAAGNKDVRFCEAHPAEAHETNALGTQNVARACREFGAKMIYLSTDLVFDCVRGDYTEDEKPEPTLAYGRSKLQGEELALKELGDVAVCRSGGIYGKRSPLLRWMSSELKANRPIECFTNVFNTPTYAENLAEMIEFVIRRGLSGILHTVGRQRVNRFEFFKAYAETLRCNVNLLTPVPAVQTNLFLQPDASLSIAETAKKLDVVFNSVAEGFNRLQASGGV